MCCSSIFTCCGSCNPFLVSLPHQQPLLSELQVVNRSQKEKEEDMRQLNSLIARFSGENANQPTTRTLVTGYVRLIPLLKEGLENQSIAVETAKKIVKEFALSGVFAGVGTVSPKTLVQCLYLTHMIEDQALTNRYIAQIKNKIERIYKLGHFEEACQLLQNISRFINEDDYKLQQFTIVEQYLRAKNICYVKIEGKNQLAIDITKITEFGQNGSVGIALRECTTAVLIRRSEDIENAIVILKQDLGSVRNFCKNLNALYFDEGNSAFGENVSQLVEFFPNITFLSIRTNSLFKKKGDLFTSLEGPDACLQDLSFLYLYNDFKKISNIHLTCRLQDRNFDNLIVMYTAQVKEISLRFPVIKCDFGQIRKYCAVGQELYASVEKDKEEIPLGMEEISCFRGARFLKIVRIESLPYVLFWVDVG